MRGKTLYINFHLYIFIEIFITFHYQVGDNIINCFLTPQLFVFCCYSQFGVELFLYSFSTISAWCYTAIYTIYDAISAINFKLSSSAMQLCEIHPIKLFSSPSIFTFHMEISFSNSRLMKKIIIKNNFSSEYKKFNSCSLTSSWSLKVRRSVVGS